MDYQNLFNEQYINQQHYKEIKSKQFSLEQQQEICKMLKALDDFMESASKIAPQYQQQAFVLHTMVENKSFHCLLELLFLPICWRQSSVIR